MSPSLLSRLPVLSLRSRAELERIIVRRPELYAPKKSLIWQVAASSLLLQREDLDNGSLNESLLFYEGRVEVEIGCSRGELLCKLAAASPRTLFLGVEISSKKCLDAEQRIAYYKLKNVRVINMEAHELISIFPLAHPAAAVHIYFPTPNQRILRSPELPKWLLCPEFVENLYGLLARDAKVRILTDHRKCADQIRYVFAAPQWRRLEFEPLQLGQPRGQYVGSPLERKNAGAQIFPFTFYKCPLIHAEPGD